MSPADSAPTSCRKSCAALALLAVAHQAVAEDVLLADDGEVAGLEALLRAPMTAMATARASAGQAPGASDGHGLDPLQAVLGEHARAAGRASRRSSRRR